MTTKKNNPVTYMDKPMHLLNTNEDNKWVVNEEAAKLLSSIDVPISVIAIVGKYRTGKSYLMNKLAGHNSGFNLGSTIRSETKGIWMWITPHPKYPNQCLLLLDTEGLYDVEKGDQNHDMHLFMFAVLLSNCMVYNAVGTIDNIFVQELHLIAELTEKIRVKKVSKGKEPDQEEEEENGLNFSTYFPSLFVVLRDFFLDLKIGGKDVSPDEYLEHSLTPKMGTAKSVQAYNAPRECIMAYFKKRKCFVLPRPVADEKIKELDRLPDKELLPEFVSKCEEAVQAFIDEAKPMTMNGNKVTGSGYLHIVQEYAKAINENQVPCIESAINVMIEGECRKAYENGVQCFREAMTEALNQKMPLEFEEMKEINAKCRNQAVDVFRAKSMFEDKGQYTARLEELDTAIENIFKEFLQKNNKVSETKAVEAINACFAQFEKDIPSFSSVKGGHAHFVAARDAAKAKYLSISNLGPMGECVLNGYLASKQDTEQAIINADKALGEEERKKALLEKEIKEKEAKIEEERKERIRIDEENQRRHDQQFELMKQMQLDMQENMDRRLEEDAATRDQMQKNHELMMEKQLKSQAKQFEMMLKAKEDDSKAREDESRRQQETMTEMMTQFKDMNVLMQERDERHSQEMLELRKEMQDSGETKQLIAEMERKHREFEQEKERLAAEVEKAKLEAEKERENNLQCSKYEPEQPQQQTPVFTWFRFIPVYNPNAPPMQPTYPYNPYNQWNE